VGRISMDLIGVDVTNCKTIPDSVILLGPHQSVDALAEAAGTIGYEILTSLGGRYHRAYIGA
jgi:alanine racemase